MMPVIAVGSNDRAHFTAGWFDTEIDPRSGVAYRWTAPEARFTLALPEGSPGIWMLVAGACCVVGRPIPLSLYAGGQLLGHAPTAAIADAWAPVLFRFNPPPGGTDEWTLRVEHFDGDTATPLPYVPHDHLGNGDVRRLGIMVAAIRALEHDAPV